MSYRRWPHGAASLLVVLACILFILLGVSFIPYAGVQNDEALFGNLLYRPLDPDLGFRAFKHSVPLMLSNHIGALKSLLYWPILAVFAPTAFVVRFPMVLAGALTIWILYRLALQVGNQLMALYAALLLATDPSFFLLDTFDWGPVALERLLLVTSAFFLARFGNRCRQRDLAVAACFLGLALWNRADFLWGIGGVAVPACSVAAGR